MSTAQAAHILATRYGRVVSRFSVHDAVTRGRIPADFRKGRWDIREEDLAAAAALFPAKG